MKVIRIITLWVRSTGVMSETWVEFKLQSIGVEVELGAVEHRLKVAKVDHLTQRQVWLVASGAGLLSGIIMIGKILKELNLW